MNQFAFIFLILVLAVGFPLFFKIKESFKKKEGYSNYTLDGAMGGFPAAQTDVLVQNSYPRINTNGISNNTSNDIWWHYPTLKLGSYAQITNNIRYPNNPDEGTCMPASMCGALYHEKQERSNYVKPLPPINPTCGTRVGYFTTNQNLMPFRTDVPNILY
jgi:hypothetical protein